MTVRDIEDEKIVFYSKPGKEKVTSLRKLNNPTKERKRTLSQAKVQEDIQVL